MTRSLWNSRDNTDTEEKRRSHSFTYGTFRVIAVMLNQTCNRVCVCDRRTFDCSLLDSFTFLVCACCHSWPPVTICRQVDKWDYLNQSSVFKFSRTIRFIASLRLLPFTCFALECMCRGNCRRTSVFLRKIRKIKSSEAAFLLFDGPYFDALQCTEDVPGEMRKVPHFPFIANFSCSTSFFFFCYRRFHTLLLLREFTNSCRESWKTPLSAMQLLRRGIVRWMGNDFQCARIIGE